MKTETRYTELRPNPFTTYRDPETGKWIVVKVESKEVEVAVA